MIHGWALALAILLTALAFALMTAAAWASRYVLLDVKRRRLLEIGELLAEIASLGVGDGDGARFEELRWRVGARLDPRWRGLEKTRNLAAALQFEPRFHPQAATAALGEIRVAVSDLRSWR